jgi:hypothetical protein
MIAMGVALLAAGLTVSVGSGVLEVQAADRQRIPLWGKDRTYRRPRSTVITRWVAGVLVASGVIVLIVTWGPTLIYLIGFLIAPHLLVVALHNRHVRVRQLAREGNKTSTPGKNSVAQPWPAAVDSPRTGPAE